MLPVALLTGGYGLSTERLEFEHDEISGLDIVRLFNMQWL
jgi:hypothetical protein